MLVRKQGRWRDNVGLPITPVPWWSNLRSYIRLANSQNIGSLGWEPHFLLALCDEGPQPSVGIECPQSRHVTLGLRSLYPTFSHLTDIISNNTQRQRWRNHHCNNNTYSIPIHLDGISHNHNGSWLSNGPHTQDQRLFIIHVRSIIN